MDCLIIENGKGGVLKKVGDVCLARFDGVEYQQVGMINKFTQVGKPRSLRAAKVSIKKMVAEAYAYV